MKTRVQYWLLFNLIIAMGVICFVLAIQLMRKLGITGCSFYELTHLYCPGCGGTRALESLLSFDIFSSLKYNAILLPGILLFLYYDIRIFIAAYLEDDDFILKNIFIPILVYVIFIIINFIVRNILLVCGIDIMLIWRKGKTLDNIKIIWYNQFNIFLEDLIYNGPWP